MSLARNHGTVVKSATGPGHAGISAREAQVAHRRSFANLLDVVEKEAGMPGDEVVYWDPMGFSNSRRQPIDLKTRLYEKFKPVYDKFNTLQRRGQSVKRAVEEVSKEMGTGDYSMPIFFTPDVRITDVQDTPLADMLTRAAVQENQIKVDHISTIGSADSFNEPGSAGGTEENWPENDDTTANYTYNVDSYGRRNNVTDFVQLSANTLRSTRALTEEAQVTAIRQYEEAQYIEGQGTVDADLSGADPEGEKGLTDYANDESNTSDAAGATITLSDVRDHIESLRRRGVNRDNILHVTDHKTFKDLQNATDDFTRYESPGDELSFGFQALSVDGTPILESHGSPYTDGERLFTSFDASVHYVAMLQDVTMHPLARDSPQEEFATDAYGVLVSEDKTRIEVTHNLA